MSPRLSRRTRAKNLLDRLEALATTYGTPDALPGYNEGRRHAYATASEKADEVLTGRGPRKTRATTLLNDLEELVESVELVQRVQGGAWDLGAVEGAHHALELARAWLLQGGRP